MQTLWGAVTDAGGRRQVNEDAVLARPPVFVVADGMGGHVDGALASQCVVQAFAEFADQLTPGTPVEPAQVTSVVQHAQDLIRARLRVTHRDEPGGQEGGAAGNAQADAEAPRTPQVPPTAGATAAGAVLTSREGTPYWLVFNIGDSRVYRQDEHGLSQISVDHSLVQDLIDAGRISPEQARTHPERHVITRAVDSTSTAEVDFWMLHAGEPQRLLLCSDGLVEELTTAQIAGLMAADRSPAEVSAELVRCAVAGGAHDNVSVVVVEPAAEIPAGTTMPRAATPSGDEDLADTLPRPGNGVLR